MDFTSKLILNPNNNFKKLMDQESDIQCSFFIIINIANNKNGLKRH